MLGILFGWRKASKCKELIKRVQLRLNLMRMKRSAIAKQLREDIAKLLKDGHDQIAFDRLDQLFLDENMKEIYELLNTFCEFVLINLPYIKRHRDCPNDVKEAVSSLVFASARFGDLPELLLLRKLFVDRYGHKFATAALELHPGNLVNHLLREKLSMNPVNEFSKNRLLDEIIRECFFKPGLLAIEYNTSPRHPQASEVPELNENVMFKEEDSPDSALEYTEESIVYLDDIEEFKSPVRGEVHNVDEQDQRMFIFKPEKSARKRQRRSLSKDYKKSVKKVREGEVDGLVQSFRFWLKEEELEVSPRRRPPYLRAATMPQERDRESGFGRSTSLPAESPVELSRRGSCSSSPRHVHPKLPDYDELEAQFMALKKVHQQANRR